MIANALAATVVQDDRLDERPSLIERSDVCRALLGILCDGRRHDIDTLALRLLGAAAERAQIVDAFDALREHGMAVVRDDVSVEARAFVPLDDDTIAASLSGWQVDVVGSISSTNSVLLQRVRSAGSSTAPMLLAAEVQHAGRGRLGRRWISAPGASLTVSFALTIARPLAALDGVTLVCGLAVRDALAAHGVTAALKWPNDLLVDGRKLAGILVEAHAGGGITTIVVGVGLNVSAHAGDAASGALPPTDFVHGGGRTSDRNLLVVAIAQALTARIARFEADGFVAFIDEWNACDAFRDRTVALRDTDASRADLARTGVARGADRRGALLLDVDGQIVSILSGDLSLRAVP